MIFWIDWEFPALTKCWSTFWMDGSLQIVMLSLELLKIQFRLFANMTFIDFFVIYTSHASINLFDPTPSMSNFSTIHIIKGMLLLLIYETVKESSTLHKKNPQYWMVKVHYRKLLNRRLSIAIFPLLNHNCSLLCSLYSSLFSFKCTSWVR